MDEKSTSWLWLLALKSAASSRITRRCSKSRCLALLAFSRHLKAIYISYQILIAFIRMTCMLYIHILGL